MPVWAVDVGLVLEDMIERLKGEKRTQWDSDYTVLLYIMAGRTGFIDGNVAVTQNR